MSGLAKKCVNPPAGPAFREKRKSLGLDAHTKGFLLWDAFGAASSTEHERQRQRWMNNYHVLIVGETLGEEPVVKTPGGWSTLGQPNDAFHQFMHKLRKAYDRAYVRQNSNVLLRGSWDKHAFLSTDESDAQASEFDRNGRTAAKLPLDAALTADMYSWRSLPEKVVRWAWRSRGLVTREEQANWADMSEEALVEQDQQCRGLLKDLIHLETLPEVHSKDLQWETDPQPGEKVQIMLLEGTENQVLVPKKLQTTLIHRISQYRQKLYNHEQAIYNRQHNGGRGPTASMAKKLEEIKASQVTQFLYECTREYVVTHDVSKLDDATLARCTLFHVDMGHPARVKQAAEEWKTVRLLERSVEAAQDEQWPAMPLPLQNASTSESEHVNELRKLLADYSSDAEDEDEDPPEEGDEDEDPAGEGDEYEDQELEEAIVGMEEDEELAYYSGSDENQFFEDSLFEDWPEGLEEDQPITGPDVLLQQCCSATVIPGDEEEDLVVMARMAHKDAWSRMQGGSRVLPLKKGIRLQRWQWSNGRVRWQAWYPGAYPASHAYTSGDSQVAFTEVVSWLWQWHRHYQKA